MTYEKNWPNYFKTIFYFRSWLLFSRVWENSVFRVLSGHLWEEGWEAFLLVSHTSDTQVGVGDNTVDMLLTFLSSFRGDWDFCSPFPRDQCQWSVWGSWGRCSTTCGAGSRTRRRRIEGLKGRVGDCSGETEVAFQACQNNECLGKTVLDWYHPHHHHHHHHRLNCRPVTHVGGDASPTYVTPAVLNLTMQKAQTLARLPSLFPANYDQPCDAAQHDTLILGHLKTNEADRSSSSGNIPLMIFSFMYEF